MTGYSVEAHKQCSGQVTDQSPLSLYFSRWMEGCPQVLSSYKSVLSLVSPVRGITRATFQRAGTRPFWSDKFISVVMISVKTLAHSFRRPVGSGSSWEEAVLKWCTINPAHIHLRMTAKVLKFLPRSTVFDTGLSYRRRDLINATLIVWIFLQKNPSNSLARW